MLEDAINSVMEIIEDESADFTGLEYMTFLNELRDRIDEVINEQIEQ